MTTKMWCANDVYYKHGEACLHSFLTEEDLFDFLMDQLHDYSKYIEVDYEAVMNDIEALIYYTINIGQQMISGQYGYGVIEVHMLDFETQTIKKY